MKFKIHAKDFYLYITFTWNTIFFMLQINVKVLREKN